MITLPIVQLFQPHCPILNSLFITITATISGVVGWAIRGDNLKP